MRDHLKERCVQLERYPFSLFVDEEERVASFYLYNLSGKIVGYHTYRPDTDNKGVHNDPKLGRYYTYVTYEGEPDGPVKARKALAFWGFETYEYRNDILFLTEGVFDAVRIHNLGLPALAVLSNDPKRIRPWRNIIHRKVVAVCDNDSAGNKLKKLADYAIVPPEKDLGDCSDEQVRELLKGF